MKTLKIDKTWTLFLDRDGVINRRLIGDYVKHPNEFELLDGVAESIAKFNQWFHKVIVVTNQQGIGKELMTIEDLDEIHDYMKELLHQKNAWVDAIYFCSELASRKDNCRKPSPQMGLRAKQDFPDIDFSKSIMVGDSISDMEFGKNLGMTTVFIDETNSENNFTDLCTTKLAYLASLLSR